LAGVAIGPFGLAIIDRVEDVKTLAEFGIIFLLFLVGLELSFDRLWIMRRVVFGLGTAQVVITGGVIGLIAWAGAMGCKRPSFWACASRCLRRLLSSSC